MIIGGLNSRARTLNIRPFDASYTEARKTYDLPDDEQEKFWLVSCSASASGKGVIRATIHSPYECTARGFFIRERMVCIPPNTLGVIAGTVGGSVIQEMATSLSIPSGKGQKKWFVGLSHFLEHGEFALPGYIWHGSSAWPYTAYLFQDAPRNWASTFWPPP